MQKIFIQTKNDFFSLQKIILKPEYIGTAEEIIKKVFEPTLFQLIEQRKEEVLCLMRQNKSTGFYPFLATWPWAILPPIEVDPETIRLTIIANEDTYAQIFQSLNDAVKNIEVLAIGDAQKVMDQLGTDENPPLGTGTLTSLAGVNAPLSPQLTVRQREIITYAVRHGFFEQPKQISAEQIASHFKISVSAFNDHIRKVEKTVMKFLFL